MGRKRSFFESDKKLTGPYPDAFVDCQVPRVGSSELPAVEVHCVFLLFMVHWQLLHFEAKQARDVHPLLGLLYLGSHFFLFFSKEIKDILDFFFCHQIVEDGSGRFIVRGDCFAAELLLHHYFVSVTFWSIKII